MAPDSRPPFATYLLPTFSLPFRRRSSTSTASALSVPSLSSSRTSSETTTPGSSPPSSQSIPISTTTPRKIYKPDLPALTRAYPNTLKCLSCSSDIAFDSQIVSKGFTGRHGRAYLISPPPYTPSSPGTKVPPPRTKPVDLTNTRTGRSANRELLTGAHVVADVSCAVCSTVLGWKYVDAKEPAQKYKIGKFILEMKRVVLGVSWENAGGVEVNDNGDAEEEGDVVVFDSEDEDECDDLFAGVWDREVVAKRRSRRVASRKKAEAEDS